MTTTGLLLRSATVILLTISTVPLLGISLAFAQKGISATSKKDDWDYHALATVPEKARAKRNPLEKDFSAPVAGRKLFQQHCAECHGQDAEGSKKGPSLLHGEVQ